MRLIIAGGRGYTLSPPDILYLDELHAQYRVTEVVSGGAPGADAGGEQWALHNRINLIRMPAEWTKYGRSAGPRRNRDMALYADAVVLFPGGAGTRSMYAEAQKANILIFDMRKGKPCPAP